jgi:hypothetical protein
VRFLAQVNDVEDLPHKPEHINWTFTSIYFLFPAIGGLLFGYDIGATSGALVSLTSQATSGTDW